jgi:putative transposase
MGKWMQWLLTSHVRQYRRRYGGSGHIWQGRFKAFPTANDTYLVSMLRYIERNALRAGLVADAGAWRWSSAGLWTASAPRPAWLMDGLERRPSDWLRWVNAPQSKAEEEALRRCVQRGAPYGSPSWVDATAKRLRLEASLRPVGRPRRRATLMEAAEM